MKRDCCCMIRKWQTRSSIRIISGSGSRSRSQRGICRRHFEASMYQCRERIDEAFLFAGMSCLAKHNSFSAAYLATRTTQREYFSSLIFIKWDSSQSCSSFQYSYTSFHPASRDINANWPPTQPSIPKTPFINTPPLISLPTPIPSLPQQHRQLHNLPRILM